jgi:hypothetical protein
MIEIEENIPSLVKKETGATIDSESDSGDLHPSVWDEKHIENIDDVWRWDNKDGVINIEN